MPTFTESPEASGPEACTAVAAVARRAKAAVSFLKGFIVMFVYGLFGLNSWLGDLLGLKRQDGFTFSSSWANSS